MDSKELKTLRLMAWQRAKGELLSILETYWEDGAPDAVDTPYDLVEETITNFVQSMDNEILGNV